VTAARDGVEPRTLPRGRPRDASRDEALRAAALTVLAEGKSVEVGLTGKDGFVGLPLIVGFNSGPWGNSAGPFNAYWKTAHGGRFLARYQDGQVNESLNSKGSLTKEELEPFVAIHPYDSARQDALFLTLSLILLSANRGGARRFDPLGVAFLEVLRPLQSGTTRATSAVGHLWSRYVSLVGVETENRELKERLGI